MRLAKSFDLKPTSGIHAQKTSPKGRKGHEVTKTGIPLVVFRCPRRARTKTSVLLYGGLLVGYVWNEHRQQIRNLRYSRLGGLRYNVTRATTFALSAQKEWRYRPLPNNIGTRLGE